MLAEQNRLKNWRRGGGRKGVGEQSEAGIELTCVGDLLQDPEEKNY